MTPHDPIVDELARLAAQRIAWLEEQHARARSPTKRRLIEARIEKCKRELQHARDASAKLHAVTMAILGSV